MFSAGTVWLAAEGSARTWSWKSWERLFGPTGPRQGALQAQPDVAGSNSLQITPFDDPNAGTGTLQGTLGIVINASGEVAGMFSSSTRVVQGFIRDASGNFTSFDSPGAGSSPPLGSVQGTIPTAIDTAGDVAGAFIDSNNAYHGFLRTTDGTITEFDAPGASTNVSRGTSAMGMNDAGQIVGFYTTGTPGDGTSTYHGFLRAANGTFTIIDAPGAGTGESSIGRKQGTTAGVINASGEIAGTYVDSNSFRHGFVRSTDGTITPFDPPGSTTSQGKGGGFSGTEVMGIDTAGDVVGAYTDASLVRHGYIRGANGTITSFDVPGATTITTSGSISGTFPLGIDPGGNYVVGTYADSSGVNHGFVYTQPLSGSGTITPFSAPNAGTAVTVALTGTAAAAVNASGEAVGGYIDTNNVAHGFLLNISSQAVATSPTFSPPAGTYASPQMVTISDTTPGATIFYTTDNSTPTTNSTVYTGPIPVNSSEMIKAIATASGFSQSAVATATYIIGTLPVAATPTFNPPSGTYATPQTVTISDTTPGATIYYTTNGTTPTTSSTLYTGPITVSSTETIQAIAIANGFSASAAATATYTINQGGPEGFILYSTVGNVHSFSLYPNSLITVDSATGMQQLVGQPGQGMNVGWLTADPVNNVLYGAGSVSMLSDATLFTMNPNSGTVSGQVTLSQSVSTIAASPQGTLYALSGNTLGTINTATGQFSPVGTVSLPSGSLLESMAFSPAGTLYGVEENNTTHSQHLITLNTANGATVSDIGSLGSYTVGDITYAPDGFIYATNFSYALLKINPQTASNTLIGFGNIGDLGGIAAIVAPLTATPSFSVAPGTYASGQTVAISDTTPAATIYYTTDGSTPTTSSTVYSSPIAVSSSQTIKAIATASGFANSAVATGTYIIGASFTIQLASGSASSATVSPGGTANYTWTITPAVPTGLPAAVTFTATGLPNGATGTFTPNPVPAGSGPTSVTLAIQTSNASALLNSGTGFWPVALSCLIVPLAGVRRRKIRVPGFLLRVFVLCALTAAMAACGGGSTGSGGGGGGGAPHSYTITITATSGQTQQTTTVSLTVQ